MYFDELDLNYDLLDAMDYMGFEKATPIQAQAIPTILDGQDLIACAQTGTGKTGAFLLPILNKLADYPTKETNTLILVPTRELAIQVEQEIQGFAYFLGVNSIAIYGGGGGDAWAQEKRALTQGANIIVATPGKLISHLNLKYVKWPKLEHLILDEADRMLDMGFLRDIERIIKALPVKRQNIMFSATMPPKIRKLAKDLLHEPKEISIAISKPAKNVKQLAYCTYDAQKIPMINHVLKTKQEGGFKSVVVFSSTRKKVGDIVRSLKRLGYKAEGISSDYDQDQRNAVLQAFRTNKLQVIVATDVLSRGIDIKGIDLVINFDVPKAAEDYVHRIGRTARADADGVAITFVNEDDMYKFNQIERLIEMQVEKGALLKELGEGPEYKKVSKRGRHRSSDGKKKSTSNKKPQNSKGKNTQSSSKKRKYYGKKKENPQEGTKPK